MKIEVAELTEQDKKERNLPKVTFSFSGFKNLKIQINDQNPLDEVVRELEKRGYVLISSDLNMEKFIITTHKGYYWIVSDIKINADFFKTTTLAELKEM